MEEHKKDLLEHLRKITGGKLLMSTGQLEQETGFTQQQQTKWRGEKELPIPHKKIGKRVFYSIYDVAEFIAGGKTYTEGRYIEIRKFHPK